MKDSIVLMILGGWLLISALVLFIFMPYQTIELRYVIEIIGMVVFAVGIMSYSFQKRRSIRKL